MKKKRIALLACLVLLNTAAAVLLLTGGKRPYKNLDDAQLASAKVFLAPPYKAVEIQDLRELTAYLQAAVIYRADNSYSEYDGQSVIFTLTMADGSRTEIMVYTPFLVIDGHGYRAKYEPCQALNGYANDLLDMDERPSAAE